MIALTDRLGLDRLSAGVRGDLAGFCIKIGLYSAALALAEELRAWAGPVGLRMRSTWEMSVWMQANTLLGLARKTRAARGRLADWIEGSPDALNRIGGFEALAQAAAADGAMDEARRLAGLGIARMRGPAGGAEAGHWSRTILVACCLVRAECDFESGNRDSAERVLESARGFEDVGAPLEARSRMAMLESRLRLAEGKPEEARAVAEETWRRDIEAGTPILYPVDVGVARLICRLLAAQGAVERRRPAGPDGPPSGGVRAGSGRRLPRGRASARLEA